MRPAAKNTVCRFQSTLSVRRATKLDGETVKLTTFQSTLSVRRATLSASGHVPHVHISIHALRKESDRRTRACRDCERISIHALRKESDPRDTLSQTDRRIFQSTLSVRRATRRHAQRVVWHHISIHALRKESDSNLMAMSNFTY